MAFGVTSIGSKGDTTARSTYTCPLARAPAANALVLVQVMLADTAGTPVQPSSVSGAGLVFSIVTSSLTFDTIASPVHNLSLWRGMGAAPDSSVISATGFVGNATGCCIIVTEVSGVSTSGTSGANAVGQSLSSRVDASSAITAIGPSAASTANAWFSCFGIGNESTLDAPGQNWTKLDFASHPTPTSGTASGWTTLSTGTAAVWSGSGVDERAAIIVELVLDNPAAGGGDVPSPYYASYYYPQVVAQC